MNVDDLHGYAGLELFEGEGEMARQGLEAALRDTFLQIVAPPRQYLDTKRDKGLMRVAVADIKIVQLDGPAFDIRAVPFSGCYQNSMDFLEDIRPYRRIYDIVCILENTVWHDNHRRHMAENIKRIALPALDHRTKPRFRQSPRPKISVEDDARFILLNTMTLIWMTATFHGIEKWLLAKVHEKTGASWSPAPKSNRN